MECAKSVSAKYIDRRKLKLTSLFFYFAAVVVLVLYWIELLKENLEFEPKKSV